MDVAYLLFKDGMLSLPMSGYDSNLFHAVAGCSHMRFDSASRTFYSGNMEADPAEIIKAIGERVCVTVKETQCSIRVQNFFSREWEIGVTNEEPPSVTPIGCWDGSAEAVEYFSLYWTEQMETELRACNYSPRTRAAYVHYNKALCRFSLKIP